MESNPKKRAFKKKKLKKLAPQWMRHEAAEALNSFDPDKIDLHDTIVGTFAVMGDEAFEVISFEQSKDFDPNEYGPKMLHGYNSIAGLSLAKVMDTVHSAIQHPEHFTHHIENMEDRFQAIRNLYEACIRQWLVVAMQVAGEQFQKGKAGDMSVAGGSQVLGLWQRVASSTVKFELPDDGDGVQWRLPPGGTIEHGLIGVTNGGEYNIVNKNDGYYDATFTPRDTAVEEWIALPDNKDIDAIKKTCDAHYENWKKGQADVNG